MKSKYLIFGLIILLIVIGLTFALVHLSISRSNDTISRIDHKIEEVMNR